MLHWYVLRSVLEHRLADIGTAQRQLIDSQSIALCERVRQEFTARAAIKRRTDQQRLPLEAAPGALGE